MTENVKPDTTKAEVEALAKHHWDDDRAYLRQAEPGWIMTAWSRARAWEKRPYILAAKFGRHPDATA